MGWSDWRAGGTFFDGTWVLVPTGLRYFFKKLQAWKTLTQTVIKTNVFSYPI
jgi:hypothetical protein